MVDPNETAEVKRLRTFLSIVARVANVRFEVRELDPAHQPAHQGEIWGRDPTPYLNTRILELGLGYAEAPVAQWHLLARNEAQAALRDALRWDQAYGSQRVERVVADRIATCFVELFDEWGRFFTNASFEKQPMPPGDSWSGTSRSRGAPELGWRATGWYGLVTGATFEAGVVAADGQRIGCLYVADED